MIDRFKNSQVNCLYNTETIRPVINEDTVCFNHTQEQVYSICNNCSFPGSSTYPPEHPIWTGYSGNHLTPLEAWTDEQLLRKAIENWFYMICMNELMVKFNPDNRTAEKLANLYTRYNNNWGNALLSKDKNMIAQYVLNRFTVAKIAPKVTALSANQVLNFMEDSLIDFSVGVYSPMSGFGGIPEGVKRWAKKHNIQKIDIECYDVNPLFCNYFNYVQKDILSEHVKTNKIVIVCPPFSEKDEHWKNTPDINCAGFSNYCGFEKWCELVTEYIKSPAYIFIGPTSKSKNNTGLFSKSTGVRWYPEYLKGFKSTGS